MYFKFDCPECGKSLKVREDQAGKKARCPYCRAQVPIPMPMVDAGESADPQAALAEAAQAVQQSQPIPIARARRREAAAPAPMSPRVAGDASAGTNVSLLTSGLIGLAFAVAFYLVLFPFRKTYLGILFYERGWVQYALAFLLGWSAAILILKLRKLRRQRESMIFDLLPNELSPAINARSVDAFAQHVRAIPVDPGRSFLVNRVLRGLEHFRIRKSHSELAGLLASQSEIDATAVDSSYTFVKVCIWAIPILGFIGTVQGISDAVGAFSGSLEAASDIAVLKNSLNDITTGLAVAFDTTLVALIMSLIVMFPMSSLQKAEEDLLNWVDEYCNENLLKRLEEADAPPEGFEPNRPAWESDAMIKAAVNAAIAGDQGLMIQQMQMLQTRLAELQQRQVEQLDKAISGITQRAEQTQHDVAKSMMTTAGNVQKYFESLERGIASLTIVLHNLGERQVIIDRPRKSWWPFGRSNGGAAKSEIPPKNGGNGDA